MSLLIVGTVAFDKIETPFGKTDKILGGAGTYIGIASSYFTDQLNIVSVIGEDFPEKYRKILKDHKMNTEGIQEVKGGQTFFWEGKYHTDMNSRDTLATELNVLADFDPIVPESYQNCEFLMLGNLDPTVQSKVLTQLKTRPKLVVMDTMDFWMDIAWDALMETVSMVDVLTINDEEARQMSGEYSLVKAARKILSMGPKYLIIKKGEHGALLFDKKENCFFAPALPLEEVFDPTGAGDTFAGGFIGYLAKTKDLSFSNMKRAIIYGSALASLTVEKFGTDKIAYLSQEALNNRIEEFKALVQVDIKMID
ncbi:MAG: PfkB family carbohydrate kinase [Flavobacteriales bacterium]|nr:PfkB family carbohydrate kinase [Flavobacteriales bacterium]